jgi:catechol 2,3-dioxygenase-like lactoylglutathione lyase family enzyme
MLAITGIDHIYITVSDLVRSEAFYDRAMSALGFRKNAFTLDADQHVQYFNRHFGVVLRPAKAARPHDPYSPGLHHICLRVESVSDLGAAASALRAAGIQATEPKLLSEYAPDYYAIFFSDPDGIRLEVTNYRAERRERHDRWDENQASS